jgi:hypothetical protein
MILSLGNGVITNSRSDNVIKIKLGDPTIVD